MILADFGAGSTPRRAVLALFGTGLIGEALLRELAKRYQTREKHLPFDWSDRSIRLQQLKRIGEELETAAPGVDSILIVWAAGRAGFLSSEQQTAGELESFREVLSMAERL